MVLPVDVLDFSKAGHIERVESTLLAGILGPSFTAIKQSAELAGSINVFHTLLVRRAIADWPILLSSHVSRERLLDMAQRLTFTVASIRCFRLTCPCKGHACLAQFDYTQSNLTTRNG